MSRIRKGFERRFRELLGELGAREREKGLRWLFERAAGTESGPQESYALAEQNVRLARKVRQFRERRRPSPNPQPLPEIICDAGLGGLARWLRASGWKAHWKQDITDAELVAEAERLNAVLITTDSFLLDRRPVANGAVRAIWVPPTLKMHEQLRLVQTELGVSISDSRCMRCGGALRQVSKAAVQNRIPPRTYRWVDEYFECEQCHQLFWQGTHWQKIVPHLDRLAHST